MTLPTNLFQISKIDNFYFPLFFLIVLKMCHFLFNDYSLKQKKTLKNIAKTNKMNIFQKINKNLEKNFKYTTYGELIK